MRTGATFERTGAMDVVLEAVDAPPALRTFARVLGWPARIIGLRGDPSMPPVVRALTALGPAYVKFGQVLSTRPDVVGDVLADELRVLQDKLPPFPEAEARAEIARALGRPVDALFSEFGPPVAAASIAQVHEAVEARTGRKVAVKVLRPGIERAFKRDVDAFFFSARMIEILSPKSRRLRPTAVIEHFSGVVAIEQDLRLEAAAAAEFRANTEQDDGFAVPEVIWPLSSRRVLTTEWVSGTPLGEVETLRREGQDLPALAERIIQTFLRHALRDGFFHADMHQGNLKIGPNAEIFAMDFGIMGRIDPFTRRVYAEILLGFLQKNYRRVAEVHFEAGYVPADRDVDAFAQALRSIGEPIFGQDASHISMAYLLSHLFDTTERFGMETRTELILLQRTMVVVEGVARSLDPQVNMWKTAQPVVEHWMRDNLGPAALLRDLGATVQVLARFGPRLPGLAEKLLVRLSEEDSPPAPNPGANLLPTLALTALVGGLVGALAVGFVFVW
jgi:ubiquinone biosynthesis protein